MRGDSLECTFEQLLVGLLRYFSPDVSHDGAKTLMTILLEHALSIANGQDPAGAKKDFEGAVAMRENLDK